MIVICLKWSLQIMQMKLHNGPNTWTCAHQPDFLDKNECVTFSDRDVHAILPKFQKSWVGCNFQEFGSGWDTIRSVSAIFSLSWVPWYPGIIVCANFSGTKNVLVEKLMRWNKTWTKDLKNVQFPGLLFCDYLCISILRLRPCNQFVIQSTTIQRISILGWK